MGDDEDRGAANSSVSAVRPARRRRKAFLALETFRTERADVARPPPGHSSAQALAVRPGEKAKVEEGSVDLFLRNLYSANLADGHCLQSLSITRQARPT
jgi:hypothetical protein